MQTFASAHAPLIVDWSIFDQDAPEGEQASIAN